MAYRHVIDSTAYVFTDLRDLLAKASPARSGDRLAGIAAESAEQMVAARMALADVPLKQFLNEAVIPYEVCEVTRLIVDGHDPKAFAPVSSLTVGSFRDWLLSGKAGRDALSEISRGITPEMAAAVSKLMRNQDLILAAKKCEVATAFRDTIGLSGRMSVRLQPNHPFDDAKGITASVLDGILLASVTYKRSVRKAGASVSHSTRSLVNGVAGSRACRSTVTAMRKGAFGARYW